MRNVPRSLNRYKSFFYILSAVVMSLGLSIGSSSKVYAHPKGLLFPIAGGGSFSNDYDGARSGGRKHLATDIFAPKGSKIVAAVAGKVTFMPINQPSYGYMVTVTDSQNFEYNYIHMNNDNPGTDDGNGGPYHAYAPDIRQGANVVRGQFLGYVGDSGNAENTPPHLHLDIYTPENAKINPYPYLLEAQSIPKPLSYPPVNNKELLPYGPDINAHTSIAIGKFDSSGEEQIVVATGKGYSPHIRVLKRDGSEISAFYAYSPSFTGGVDVAAGDVDGDGVDEIITGTLSGAPHVRALKINGSEVAGFYAYSPSFAGGVNVSAIDAVGDSKKEILTGSGRGGGPHVRVFNRNGGEVAGFYAYSPTFTGGIDVAAGDVGGVDNKEEIVTAAGPGGSAHTRLFTRLGAAMGQGFNSYEAYTGYTGGARVSVGNVRTSTPKSEILVSPWFAGGPHIRLLDKNGQPVSENYYYETWWTGYYDVAAGNGFSLVSSGTNRRSSIRPGPQ